MSALSDDDWQRHFLRALRTLPDKQQEVFRLSARDDLSYAEIADQLGIPVAEVVEALTDALLRLMEIMDADDDGYQQVDDRPNAPRWRRLLLSIWRRHG